MKKILSIIMALMLTLSLAFTAFACTPEKPDESVQTSENVGESKSEPESVYIPEPIVGAGEDGAINLEQVLEFFDPVLDNDYATISIDGEVDISQNGEEYFTAQVRANAYLKRTVKGYDMIAKITVTIDHTPADINIYFVDGLAVIGGGEDYYEAYEVGSFNALINMLNQEIANDPDMSEAYLAIMPVLEEVKGMLGGEDAIPSIQFSLDFAPTLNEVVDFVLVNQGESIHDLLLSLLGIEPTDEESISAIKDFMEEFYADNPSVTVFIERIVSTINEIIMESARSDAELEGVEFDEDEVFQIDLKEIVDALQEKIGMTTAEIVSTLNAELSGSGFVLPAPELGETIYDYMTVYLEAITIDTLVQAIVGDESVTFTDLVDTLIELTKEITLKDAVNAIASLIEYGDLSAETDWVAVIEEMGLTIDATTVYFAYASDDMQRPTSLALNLNGKVSFGGGVDEEGETVTQDITASVSLSCSFEYAKPVIEFKIPQSVLDMAEFVEI